MDYGHKQADKMLAKLEKRISKEYRIAARDVEKSMNKYLAHLAENDALMAELVAQGKVSRSEYLMWRKKQILITDKWVDMREELTDRYMHANANASALIGDHTLDVYALNFNYGTYEAEIGARVNTAFTLYNRDVVARLMVDNPKLLPPIGEKAAKAIKEGKAKRWTSRQIQSVMTQSVLTGESIPKIAKRLANTVGEKSKVSAIRAARTMTTCAENAGRLDSYERATKYGIVMGKTWLSAHDARVRASHRALDGETVALDEKFSNELMYPADPDGDPEEIYNCRCSMVGTVLSVDNVDISDLTEIKDWGSQWDIDYEEWAEGH